MYICFDIIIVLFSKFAKLQVQIAGAKLRVQSCGCKVAGAKLRVQNYAGVKLCRNKVVGSKSVRV